MDWMNVAFWLAGTLVTVLGPIILIHELGHFVFAKLAGVRVEEFGLGFPPRLLKLWRGKGSVEVGGTCLVIPRGFRLPPGLEAGASARATARRQRDGTCLLRHIAPTIPAAGDEPAQEVGGEDVHLHLHGVVSALEPGTLYSLNLLPMGAFVRMTGEEDPSDPRSLAAQPKRWRLATLGAGAALNLVAALLLLVGVYVSGVPEGWAARVNTVVVETAAEEAGLEVGDVVLSAAGERIEEGPLQLTEIIRASAGQSLQLVVLRGEETLTLAATPRQCQEAETCGEDGVGKGILGIVMESWPNPALMRRYGMAEAARTSLDEFANVIVTLVKIPARLIRGDVTVEEARPTSVVGASGLLAFALQQSIRWKLAFPVLHTAALTSLALGLTNLLPLPAFDGGRILFVLIEVLRGRRVPPEREALVHVVGMAILLALMAIVIVEDIVNPIIPWSWLE